MGEFENVYKTGINANKSARESKGSMYEVDIDARPEELLDYDLPLGEQPEILQRIDDKYGDSEIFLSQMGGLDKSSRGGELCCTRR